MVAVFLEKRAFSINWQFLEKRGASKLAEQQAILRPVLQLFCDEIVIPMKDSTLADNSSSKQHHSIFYLCFSNIPKLKAPNAKTPNAEVGSGTASVLSILMTCPTSARSPLLVT